MDDTSDAAPWMVIANAEDECAIWAAEAPVPPAWRGVGVSGTRAECDAFVQHLETERDAAVMRRWSERGTIRP